MERELPFVKGLHSAGGWHGGPKDDFIDLSVRLLFAFFKRSNLRIRKVEQTAKTIEGGSDRGKIQNSMSLNPEGRNEEGGLSRCMEGQTTV